MVVEMVMVIAMVMVIMMVMVMVVTTQWEGDDGTNCAAVVGESHKLSFLRLGNPSARDNFDTFR